LPTLLNAWKALGEEEAELIIAGYGNIPKNVSIPENVKILGAILPEKRAQLYAQADVFVFPSFFEGFAQVQVEAAACGLPIIGTQNSGAEEIIQDGYNGFIVEPGNIDQLVSAMRFFVKNREKLAVMSAKVRERIDFFSWNSYGNRWKAILETKLS
jgi:glycosyltransferase involved in cell wall biosynthesis